MAHGVPHHQELALRFLEVPHYAENLLFIRSLDTFFEYQDGYYSPIQDKDFAILIFEYLRTAYPQQNIRQNLVSELLQQIKWCAPRKLEEIGAPILAFKDCLLDIEENKTEPHSRDVPAILALPYEYEKIKNLTIDDAPHFKRFMESVFVKEEDQRTTDLDMVAFMQEVLGFYLIPNLKGSSVFFFIGGGANGKSVLADIITAMVGRTFCSSMSIETLTVDKFASSHLIGKYLNVCNEEESKYMRSDRFKAMVTGDMMTGEKKYGDHFEFRPHAKFLFCSNVMPTFDAMNYGLQRRIRIVPFFRRFSPEERDLLLTKKLLQELPAIISFALQGARRLIERNYVFKEPQSVIDSMNEFEISSSSVIAFARERLVQTNDKYNTTSILVLYDGYRAWCEQNGKKPANAISFGRELGSAFPTSHVFFTKDDERKTVRVRDLVFKENYNGEPPLNLYGLDGEPAADTKGEGGVDSGVRGSGEAGQPPAIPF